jgi:hypothetical protein
MLCYLSHSLAPDGTYEGVAVRENAIAIADPGPGSFAEGRHSQVCWSISKFFFND